MTKEENELSLSVSQRPRRGRPPKSVVEQNKKPGKGKVGRPVGTQGRIEEFKARLLSTTGNKVIDTVVRIALDDEHPGQMAALKMCLDRQLPLSLFEKEAKGRGNAVTINIVGVSEMQTVGTIDAEDIEYTDSEE